MAQLPHVVQAKVLGGEVGSQPNCKKICSVSTGTKFLQSFKLCTGIRLSAVVTLDRKLSDIWSRGGTLGIIAVCRLQTLSSRKRSYIKQRRAYRLQAIVTAPACWKGWSRDDGILAAHLETTMGKMPAQMVTKGTAMKKGVAMAPTM